MPKRLRTDQISQRGPQPGLLQYNVFAAAGGTLTFELLDEDGTTVFAGTQSYNAGATGLWALIRTNVQAAQADQNRPAVAALISASTDLRWNTGRTVDGDSLVAASASSLGLFAAGVTYEIGWVA